MQSQLKELLDMMSTDTYITAKDISTRFQISLKIVRNRMKDLRAELKYFGADIVSKPRYGYQLVIEEPLLYSKIFQIQESDIPENSEAREKFILSYLINHDDYIKVDDLEELLYITRNRISASLKKVEFLANRYYLRLERKPNYGIAIKGNEFDKRRLICDYFMNTNELKKSFYENQDIELKEIANLVIPLLQEYELHLSETAFENFIEYLLIQRERIKQHFMIGDNGENLLSIGIKEIAFCNDLVQHLENEFHLTYPLYEQNYILLHIAGKRNVGNVNNNESNFVIKEEIDRLVMEMINAIYQEFQIDMRSNFDIRMGLNQHLVPFDIRMRYDIPFANPMLEDIKQNYSFAYRIALFIRPLLEKVYQKLIPEDEIGYFALIFQLAIEQKKSSQKRNILIICSTGKSSSRLLMYRYKHEFKDYIDHIYVCDSFEMNTFDYNLVDYVFTTIPINIEIPKPIVKINNFLENDDIQRIKKILEHNEDEIIKKYYCPERLILDLEASSKEEALEKLCQIVVEKEGVNSLFLQSVLEREDIESTDFGNYIAIPHPKDVFLKETFVYVAVLKEPILWSRNIVQLIILTAIGEDIDDSIQKFYELTSQFSLNIEAIQAFISNPTYDFLIQLMKEQ